MDKGGDEGVEGDESGQGSGRGKGEQVFITIAVAKNDRATIN